MKDNDQLDNKNANTKPSGFFEKPPIIFAKANVENNNYDNNFMIWPIISLAIGVFAVFTWCLLGSRRICKYHSK